MKKHFLQQLKLLVNGEKVLGPFSPFIFLYRPEKERLTLEHKKRDTAVSQPC